ncbi:hypothetical protein [Mycobacterium rhizamassiliense]|jgi:hypothetical protein|nr:hypothetical protein [Mycobacterium rhizamassiliense]
MRKLVVAIVLAFAVLATAGCGPITFTLEAAGASDPGTAVPTGITSGVLN